MEQVLILHRWPTVKETERGVNSGVKKLANVEIHLFHGRKKHIGEILQSPDPDNSDKIRKSTIFQV